MLRSMCAAALLWVSGVIGLWIASNSVAVAQEPQAAGEIKAPPNATVIDGAGRTLMPGLIDAHTHLMFETLTQEAVLTADLVFVTTAAVMGSQDMLRGFTSVRDVGRPVLGLNRGIDKGLVVGPRIWPSGAMISQTGGQGDFRLPPELPASPGSFHFSERMGAAAIADDADTVRADDAEDKAVEFVKKLKGV